jgi:predicted dehydrogenase
MTPTLRIGILGAARIAELSIVAPAHMTGARLVAVAARDQERAKAFAARHGVERVAASYAEVVEAPDVDIVYNPLPNSLHAPWNLSAIHAGKHVLSEKPSASNADEAEEVRAAARHTGLIIMEGFHYLFHPVTRRLHELLSSGELGELVHVQTRMLMPDPGPDDPRWQLSLAGGATMDLGCYGLHAHRMQASAAGGEPAVMSARAGERVGSPGVDEWMDVELLFPSGVTGTARCHMASDHWDMSYRIIGSRGEATALNFVQPHLDDRVIIRTPNGERVEHLGTRSSYTYQLEAFAAAVTGVSPVPIDADDALENMRLIDACYAAAGLHPRPPVTKTTSIPATSDVIPPEREGAS